MENNGWIKIHRKIREWQHYGEPSVLVVFIDLLLSAKTENGWVHGVKVERGQVFTSIARLMQNTGLGSDNTVRRALKKLVESGEIEKKSTNAYTLITINHFDKYQCYANNEQQTAEQGAEQTAEPTAEQGAHIKEYKERKERKNIRNTSTARTEVRIPTLEEVQKYINDNRLIVDALEFYAYYEANGWMCGRKPMQKWKAALVSWNKKRQKESQPQTATTTKSYDMEDYKAHMAKYDHPNAISYEQYQKNKS